MDRLNFNHLYYFYIVAKEGSIKLASERLHVSQPTISDQIKLLEDFFHCELFHRRNRSLILSEEGHLALGYAEKSFELSRELTNRLRNKIQLPKRSLEIGITNFMSQYFIYDRIMPLFNQEEVSLNFVEKQRHLLLAELEEENLDIVFTDDKTSISSTMLAYRVGQNRTFAVAHKKYQKFKKGFPESLNKVPFFNYTRNSSLRYEIELFFSRNSIAPKTLGEADDVDLFQVVTEGGHAFTIVPEVAKNRFCLNNDLIVLGELEELQTSVWGIVRKDYNGMLNSLLKKKRKK